jgi:putative phage-type endonuclease
MSKEEWVAQRQKTIGGSDAGIIVGMNQYSSPYSLWAIKTGRLIPEDISSKESVRLGNDLEEYVAKRFTEATGKKLRRDNNFVYNSDYPFAHVQADRLVCGEDAGFEAKTTSNYENIKNCKNGKFNDSWYAQCVHGMMVTGLKKWYLGVLCFGHGFFYFEIERDENEINALAKAERDFWTLVENDTPPSADGEASTTDTLNSLYPNSNGETISLLGYDNVLKQYMDITAQIKSLTALKDEMANKVKDYMKESAKGETDNFKASWATQSRSTFDHKQFKEDHPDIDMDDYYKTTSSRVFKVTEINK